MPGLTNMPSVWGDLQMNAGAEQNQEQLGAQGDLLKKKKIMSAGQMGDQMLTAVQQLFGSKTPGAL